MSGRGVKLVFESMEQSEGMGARVRRSIGRPELRQLDPFLLLDEFNVKLPAGFPDHPHRGFETVSAEKCKTCDYVTYLISGCGSHEDFAGNAGTLNAGDLQWMTAGRGVVHCEMPNPDNTGLQLWVNLRSSEKMVPPAYQDLKKKDIPIARTPDGLVIAAVIAGNCMDVKSPVRTRTPTSYLDFTVKPGGKFEQPVDSEWNVFAYILEGSLTFDGKNTIQAHHTVLFEKDGNETVNFENRGSIDVRFVLIAGKPIGEPVVQHGPFVMNTQEEILRTIEDYREGKNGFENARKWKSKHVQRRK